MSVPRYLEKFTDVTGSATVYTFPLNMYEYDSSQALVPAQERAVGANYSWDHLNYGPAPKQDGKEVVRFLSVQNTTALLETDLDNVRSKCYRIGKGKLWLLASDGTRRFCYARLAAKPSVSLRAINRRHAPVQMEFIRLSDWMDDTLVTGSQASLATGTTWTITNAGTAEVSDLIVVLTSGSAAGYTNPSISNTTMGQTVATTRDAASTSSRLKIDNSKKQVLVSSDAGATYADDFALVTLAVKQVDLLTLAPGDNSFLFASDGAVNTTISWSYHTSYE